MFFFNNKTDVFSIRRRADRGFKEEVYKVSLQYFDNAEKNKKKKGTKNMKKGNKKSNTSRITKIIAFNLLLKNSFNVISP